VTEDGGQYRPPHTAPAGYGFDGGQLVPITPPEVWADDDERLLEKGAARAGVDLLTRLVCEILDGGHRDAVGTRATAAARILNLIATDSAAARRAKVARSTMKRAKEKMLRKLMQQAPR